MDGLGPHKVRGDSRSRPNSPTSVEGGQASHAPSIREQGQAAGGVMDILQRIAQAQKRAAQPSTVVPQRSTIERMITSCSLGRKMMSLPWRKIGS